MLSVRHSAWLNAVPEKSKGDKSEGPGKARIERIEALGVDAPMPEADAAYLLTYFWEVGPTVAGGMSGAPVCDQRLAYWMQNTGIQLQPWETRALISMSKAYVVEATKGTARNCPAPFQPDLYARLVRATNARDMEAAFDADLED